MGSKTEAAWCDLGVTSVLPRSSLSSPHLVGEGQWGALGQLCPCSGAAPHAGATPEERWSGFGQATRQLAVVCPQTLCSGECLAKSPVNSLAITGHPAKKLPRCGGGTALHSLPSVPLQHPNPCQLKQLH